MPKPMFNPQPNYSGVTIQITNPAVNVNPYGAQCNVPNGCAVNNANYPPYVQTTYNPSINYDNRYENTNPPYVPQVEYTQQPSAEQFNPQPSLQNNNYNSNNQTGYIPVYPPEYYINNYNSQYNTNPNRSQYPENSNYYNNRGMETNNQPYPNAVNTDINQYKDYANSYDEDTSTEMTVSNNIKSELDKRNAEIKEVKKNTKEKKIVALTDEYIKSLENYLNSPNDEVRLMASKEILTRLDEDRNRYDDAALNALLNKMLQDPSKIIRLAALSAFASQLACGNDYTVQLLQNIQSNPNADKEDALQAADILLKMSAGVEVVDIPASEEEKREVYKMKPRKSA